jgi:hypothetical protein
MRLSVSPDVFGKDTRGVGGQPMTEGILPGPSLALVSYGPWCSAARSGG